MAEEESRMEEIEKDVRENVRIGNEPMTEPYPPEAMGAKEEVYTPEEKAEPSITEPPACKTPEVPTIAEAPCDQKPEDFEPAAEAGEGAGFQEAWKDVGNQFAALGAGLATAFRTAWTSEESRRHMREMRGGLEAMVNELGAAIREGASTPEAQQVRTEAGRTATTVRTAGEKTVQELRPRIVSALSELNEDIRKLVGRMRREEEEAQGGAAPETATTMPPAGGAAGTEAAGAAGPESGRSGGACEMPDEAEPINAGEAPPTRPAGETAGGPKDEGANI